MLADLKKKSGCIGFRFRVSISQTKADQLLTGWAALLLANPDGSSDVQTVLVEVVFPLIIPNRAQPGIKGICSQSARRTGITSGEWDLKRSSIIRRFSSTLKPPRYDLGPIRRQRFTYE